MIATIGSPINSTRPRIAVSLGERSGLRQNPGRNGPGGGRSGSTRSSFTPLSLTARRRISRVQGTLFFFRKNFRFDCEAVSTAALLVIAKQPVAGRAKTRLTPPCTPQQAALLADAALRDTLEVVAMTPVDRRVLVFEGDPQAWGAPTGFEVISQRGAGLGERLQAAFDDIAQPALLIGMDTPQVTSAQLLAGLRSLTETSVDSILGPTADGGYWCVGFREPVPGAFAGVPMSAADTYVRQRGRLAELGMRVGRQPLLRDVDTIDDAKAVAALAPGSRFARALGAIR
ncbi:MAG TPA: TIGR04282 family arsenosugar biosynthesis glycosyltransferase [Solirubrobacteraceae bacterium]|nr:TIGR04282 family arsenosugar biosynthesis glycosyltransferase [Solirubrobacteraceae bacterium]